MSNKKTRCNYFWIGFLIFIISLSYSLPRFSYPAKIKEEKDIIHNLVGSDPVHIQWHEHHSRKLESDLMLARFIFLIGIGFLCYSLYCISEKR